MKNFEMQGFRRLLTCALALGTAACLQAAALAASQAPRNVLLICVDDLRPVPGCYGGAAKTPNMDRFAESSVVFQRHYVSFPSCGPSRASLMSGLRPDVYGIYGNNSRVEEIARHAGTSPTLPQYFLDHGYRTLSFGKTYHSRGAGPGYGWSEKPWHPPSGWTCYVDFKHPNKTDESGRTVWRPAYEIYDGPDSLHGDYQTADRAIEALESNRERPFFIAAGFYKPHLPFVAPKRFWDLYPDASIETVKPPAIPDGAARYQYGWSEIWAYGLEKGILFTKQLQPTAVQRKNMIHAYYAAVSFIDAQVGRLLDKVEELGLAKNTAVVLWSDHGFHLGDQERWAKWTQFEADMRSPLMIRLPGAHSSGRNTQALVETIDLYPTLVDYCGLERPRHLVGESLVPLIEGKVAQVKPVALSQVRPLGEGPGNLLAYSIRTAEYRYVQWRDTNQAYNLVYEELYDLRRSLAETKNAIKEPSYQEVLPALRRYVESGYSSLK